MEELTKGMVRVFSQVVWGEDNRKKIANTLGLSKTWVSDNLTKLEKSRFVTKKKRGKEVYLGVAETSFAQELKNLVESQPTIRFDDFLYGLNFRILSYCLFLGKTSESIAQQLGLSQKTICNRLPDLMARGLLAKNRKFYLTNKKAWPILYNFLEKFRMFYSGQGRILWKFWGELLLCVTQKRDIKGSLTGFSQYPRLGVGMIGIRFCCYQPKKRLVKEEIFIHSLLEITDSRELMLCLVFYLKHRLNQKKLNELAMKYDCLEKLKDLEKLLKQEQPRILPFIKENELKEFFEGYGALWKRH